jgi:uncharacterized protein
MNDLLDLILKHITTHPEEVTIDTADENGVTVYTINVAADDMGRVIGKDGKVIRAIRSLAHVIAVRQGKRFRIKLADEEVQTTEPEDLIAGAIDVSKE